MLGDPDLARDAAQEACLRAMLGLDHLRDDARFGVWLVGIGLNVCRGWLSTAHPQVSYDAMRASGRLSEPVSEGAHPVQLIPMRVAGMRRTAPTEAGVERHVVLLEDDAGRRLPIWIGQPEANAMALVLERVELPRPGVFQFAASLLAGAGGRLREVRVTELTESVFYARAVLSDGTSADARPSDALTLALVNGAPIYVDAGVLERAREIAAERGELIREAEEATDDARVIAAEARAAHAASMARLHEPDPTDRGRAG